MILRSLALITECSICLQTLSDPRYLPTCPHKFCLQCLHSYVEKLDEVGEDLKCPLCRKEFSIPVGGVDALPKKFFHQDIPRATSLRQNDTPECLICLQTWSDPRYLPTCPHKFCLQCLRSYVEKLDEEGEDLKCPLCRKEFSIPVGGVDALPKKFFHQDVPRATSLRQNDTPECLICLQTWSDPRYLPTCHHKFCLKCLRSYVEKLDEEGEDLKCPLCRKEFSIPAGGIDALPKNFIHHDVSRATSQWQNYTPETSTELHPECISEVSTLCEFCATNVAATTYCVDCDQNICTTCSPAHLRARASINHNIVNLKENLCDSYCEQHEEERVKFYCEELNCKKLLCTICHATEHVAHKCMVINKAVQGFVDKITVCDADIDKGIAKRENHLGQLEKDRNEFLKRISENEQKVEEKKEEMKKVIEEEHKQLWNELNQIKVGRLKEMDTRQNEIKTELSVWKNHKIKSKELIDKGSTSDICRSANGIIAGANALINSRKDFTRQRLDPPDVCFMPAAIPDISGCKVHFVGIIEPTNILKKYVSGFLHENKKQITIDRMYEMQTNETSEFLNWINQSESKLKQKSSEVEKLKQQLSAQVNDITVLTNTHAQAEAELQKQLQLQQSTKQKSKHAEYEADHKKELKPLQVDEQSLSKDQSTVNKQGQLDERFHLPQQENWAQVKQVAELKKEFERNKDNENQGEKRHPVKTVTEKYDEANKEQCSIVQSFLTKSSVNNIIPGKGKVYGVSVISNELYVARHGTPHVEVYDTNNFSATSRLLKIGPKTLNQPRLATCSHHNCLYIKHYTSFTVSVIYRFELSNSSDTNWTVKGQCTGISVTNDKNLLVTLNNEKRVLEYTTHGDLIREIILHKIDHPLHCVQLSNGNFVVSHEADYWQQHHGVDVVNVNGRIVKSYDGAKGSGFDRLKCPCHLLVDSSDHIFIADQSNNRVQLFSPTLTLLGTVQTPGHQLNNPNTVYLDEVNHRLYIGEERSGRVLVVESS